MVIHTDGASRSNPGPAAYGLSAAEVSSGRIIYEEAQAIGRKTNNEAEYQGILRALELSAENKIKKLLIKTDSQLAVQQLKGAYKVKALLLKPIYQKCLKRIQKIPAVEFIHVPREENKRADELANLALDSC